eukprot:2722134-Amphidinium_carterae.1
MEITQHGSRASSDPVRRRASERRDAVIPYASQTPRTPRGKPVVRTPNANKFQEREQRAEALVRDQQQYEEIFMRRVVHSQGEHDRAEMIYQQIVQQPIPGQHTQVSDHIERIRSKLASVYEHRWNEVCQEGRVEYAR